MQKIIFSIVLLIVGFCINAFAQTPIAKYTFDNGTATDAMGNYNGTLNAVTATANRFGEAGKAVRFASTVNATNAFISCGDITQLNGANKYTFAAWINDEDVAGVHGLYAKRLPNNFITTRIYQNAIYSYNATNASTYYWGGGSGLPNGVWSHVAVVFDGTLAEADRTKIYINGTNVVIAGATVAGGSPTVTPNLAGADFEIGRSVLNQSSYSFRGAMDEVYIYNVALTPTQVMAVMNTDTPTSTDPLIAHYKFDSATGITADATINNNTLVNAAAAATLSNSTGTDQNAVFANAALLSSASAQLRPGSVTVTGWINRSAVQQYSCVAGVRYTPEATPYNSYFLSTGSTNSNKLNFSFSTTSTDDIQILSTTSLALSTWYHVAASYDAATGVSKIYVNGILENTSTNSPGSIKYSGTQNFCIGNMANVPVTAFTGEMDDIMIYRKALTDAEVLNVKNTTTYAITSVSCANFNVTPTFTGGAGCASEMKLTGTANFPVSVSFAWTGGGGSGPYSVAAFPRIFDGFCPENYQTIITDALGCTIAYNFTVANGTVSGVAVGTEKRELQNSVTISPNPVHDILFIKTTNTDLTNLQIIDIMGRMVEQISQNIPNSLDLIDLQSGVYFVRVSDKIGNSFVQKIIKE